MSDRDPIYRKLWVGIRPRLYLLTESGAAAVYMYLLTRVHHETGQCNPSIATIAADLQMDTKTVRKAFKLIEAAGVAKRTPMKGASDQWEFTTLDITKEQHVEPASAKQRRQAKKPMQAPQPAPVPSTATVPQSMPAPTPVYEPQPQPAPTPAAEPLAPPAPIFADVPKLGPTPTPQPSTSPPFIPALPIVIGTQVTPRPPVIVDQEALVEAARREGLLDPAPRHRYD